MKKFVMAALVLLSTSTSHAGGLGTFCALMLTQKSRDRVVTNTETALRARLIASIVQHWDWLLKSVEWTEQEVAWLTDNVLIPAGAGELKRVSPAVEGLSRFDGIYFVFRGHLELRSPEDYWQRMVKRFALEMLLTAKSSGVLSFEIQNDRYARLYVLMRTCFVGYGENQPQ